MYRVFFGDQFIRIMQIELHRLYERGSLVNTLEKVVLYINNTILYIVLQYFHTRLKDLLPPTDSANPQIYEVSYENIKYARCGFFRIFEFFRLRSRELRST